MDQIATTPEPSRGYRIARAALAFVGCAVWLPVIFIVVFIAPKFDDISTKFNIRGDLPDLTVLVMSAGSVVGPYWYFLAGALVLVTGVLTGFAYRSHSRKGLALAGIFAAVSSVLSLVIVMFLSLVLNVLIHSVGQRH